MPTNRRQFFTKFGLGSLALASLPSIVDALAAPALAEAARNYHFVATSAAGSEGTPASPRHQVFMTGEGKFNPTKPGSPVSGGGFYVHYLFPGRNPLPGEAPLPVVAWGTWKPRTLVSYKELGTWAAEVAGVMDMLADLFQESPSKIVLRGVRVQVACNVPSAGFNTGLEEGFILSLPGTDFSQGGTPGPFVPLLPPRGVSMFSSVTIPWPTP